MATQYNLFDISTSGVVISGDSPSEKHIGIDVVIPVELLQYIDRLIQTFAVKCWTYEDLQGLHRDFRDRILRSINATEWAIFILLNAVAETKVQGRSRLLHDDIRKVFGDVVKNKARKHFTLDMGYSDDYRILLGELITQVITETELH